MKKILFTFALTAIFLSGSELTITKAKVFKEMSSKIEADTIKKIKTSKSAKKVIKDMLNITEKQLEEQAKRGFMVGALINIKDGMILWSDASRHVIISEYYKILESNGYIVKDKVYNIPMSIKVYWK